MGVISQSSIRTAVRLVAEVGPADSVRGAAEIVRNRRLRAKHGFDSWHTEAPFHWRPYKARVVEAVDSLRPRTVVEIGCGLGDIIARVDSDVRIGVDQEHAVIAAAREISPATQFVASDLASSAEILPSVTPQGIDVLVMVNWPHDVPLRDLAAGLGSLRRVAGVRYLVIDSINPEVYHYRYRHTVAELGQLGTVVKFEQNIDEFRSLVTLEVEL